MQRSGDVARKKGNGYKEEKSQGLQALHKEKEKIISPTNILDKIIY